MDTPICISDLQVGKYSSPVTITERGASAVTGRKHSIWRIYGFSGPNGILRLFENVPA